MTISTSLSLRCYQFLIFLIFFTISSSCFPKPLCCFLSHIFGCCFFLVFFFLFAYMEQKYKELYDMSLRPSKCFYERRGYAEGFKTLFLSICGFKLWKSVGVKCIRNVQWRPSIWPQIWRWSYRSRCIQFTGARRNHREGPGYEFGICSGFSEFLFNASNPFKNTQKVNKDYKNVYLNQFR